MIPYVGKSGKFTMHRLVTWYCFPEQAVASLTSTVYTRLLKIWRGRKKRFRDIRRLDHQLLLKVAALYTVTHSDYILDRALACLHRPGPLSGVLRYFVRKLDDKFWFVYRQVCLQTNWLTFQSLGISDKSSRAVLRDFMSYDSKKYRNSVIREAFETASDVTVLTKFRTTPYVQDLKLRGNKATSDPVILAFFNDWSDPDSD